MQIAVPDYVSNSYFPAIAAVELGYFEDEGIDATIELRFPVTDAAYALRDGRIDLLAGAAHAPMRAFPQMRGVRLLAALSRNMYWFLIVRSDLPVGRKALGELRDMRIGVADGPDLGLMQMLDDAHIDLGAAGLRVGPIPSDGDSSSISFGVSAARALERGDVDAFWANGMAAEVAVSTGVGKVVVDARRDGGEHENLTFSALMATERFVTDDPDRAAAAIRALVRTQDALRNDPGLATQLGARLFPAQESGLIQGIIERDAPFYRPQILQRDVDGLNRLGLSQGLLTEAVEYSDVVSQSLTRWWDAPAVPS